MKSIRLFITLLLFATYTASISSCSITFKSNNGKHKGWFKNPKNPHHPNHEKKKNSGNGGHDKGHQKGKKK